MTAYSYNPKPRGPQDPGELHRPDHGRSAEADGGDARSRRIGRGPPGGGAAGGIERRAGPPRRGRPGDHAGDLRDDVRRRRLWAPTGTSRRSGTRSSTQQRNLIGDEVYPIGDGILWKGSAIRGFQAQRRGQPMIDEMQGPAGWRFRRTGTGARGNDVWHASTPPVSAASPPGAATGGVGRFTLDGDDGQPDGGTSS